MRQLDHNKAKSILLLINRLVIMVGIALCAVSNAVSHKNMNFSGYLWGIGSIIMVIDGAYYLIIRQPSDNELNKEKEYRVKRALSIITGMIMILFGAFLGVMCVIRFK